MISVKKIKINEFNRKLVAFKDGKEVAKTCYSIAITRTKGVFDAESEIEDELNKRFPGEKILYDY